MERLENISTWKVDTENKDKILEVTGENISAEEIERTVREAGFEIEPAKEGFFKKLFWREGEGTSKSYYRHRETFKKLKTELS